MAGPALDVIPIDEALPVVEPSPHLAAAAGFLDRAVAAGCTDPQVLYMLALAHKRQGKIAEAREALRKISKPDANVLLQMALLSLQESNLVQAEGELLRAREADSGSYEVCYNLLLTQLTLRKLEACAALLPAALELLNRRGDTEGAAEERHFLEGLQVLLEACGQAGGESDVPAIRHPPPATNLADLTPQDEQRLLKIIRSLGQLETALPLLQALNEARPRSAAVREAYVEVVLAKAKELMDRCAWTDAELLLQPLAREKGLGRNSQVALLNLLGCCACLTQDFDGAARHFGAAIKLATTDARLYQNLALTYELKGDLVGADPYWNRYFDLLDERVPVPPDRPRYRDTLAFESLSRLAGRYGEKEKWSSALAYVQRAQALRPNDPEVLEHLFQLYTQAKRTQDARRTLEQLRRLRPSEPQYELYELDLVEVKGLTDIERLLNDIDRIRKRYPGDARVDQRAIIMVGNVIPLMGNLCDQLNNQMSKVVDQVRNLPNYQINWSAVREVMRDLLREFQKLRRITGKCLPLVTSDEHKRIVRDLADHIDKKMEACRSMGA
jgi:tetratricopeptide (TPR) repeat protein